MNNNNYDELPSEHKDLFLGFLNRLIKISLKVLAALMVIVIFWGVGDVLYVLYNKLISPPFMLLNITDIFQTFAAFLAVLIAIEIFQNIVLYIHSDVLPVKLVIATALMAISRKVIIFDYKELDYLYVFATATTVLALGITYYLVDKKKDNPKDSKHE